MMDIVVEVLASSVPVEKEYVKYKIKTWWAHVDIEDAKNLVQLPGLPMIEQYYNISGKDTTIFVEIWYRNEDISPLENIKFIGMAKCQVDEQLKNSRRNPSVMWLEVYDPIEDIVRGRILLKVDAKFTTESNNVPPPALFPATMDLATNEKATGLGSPSSYFMSQKHSSPASTSLFDSLSTVYDSPSKRSVTIQTDTSAFGSPCDSLIQTCRTSDKTDNDDPSSDHPDRQFFSNESLPSNSPNSKVLRCQGMEKVNKEKVNKKKKVEDNGSPFNVRVGGKTYTIQIDPSGPKVFSTNRTKLIPSIEKRPSKSNQFKQSSNISDVLSSRAESSVPSKIGTSDVTLDDSVEDVIHMLNDNFDDMLLGNGKTNLSIKEQNNSGKTSLSEFRKVASGGLDGLITKNPEVLGLRRQQQMYRGASESEASEYSVSPQKPGRLAPEGQNETETDTSDFSPIGPSRLDVGVLGLGFKQRSTGPSNISDDPHLKVTPRDQSHIPIQIKRIEDPNCKDNTKTNGRPPMSRRMAAAIFND